MQRLKTSTGMLVCTCSQPTVLGGVGVVSGRCRCQADSTLLFNCFVPFALFPLPLCCPLLLVMITSQVFLLLRGVVLAVTF